MKKDRILITGANGQIGSVLTGALRATYGTDAVLATDIRKKDDQEGPFEILDVLDSSRMAELIQTYQITQVYHLAAILSAKGEQAPQSTWNINMNSLFNVLRLANEGQLDKVFFPSSIAVFGPDTPAVHTPQQTILTPHTVYGISKVAGELWCQYFHQRYHLDVRSLRYPGIIGYQSMPGGGTTDYAVEIYHEALKQQQYTCFLKPDTRLPMIYMDDAIRATMELMDAPADSLTIRTSYNLGAMDFTPAEIASAIQHQMPDFEINYEPDFRQAIADSWPDSIDDSQARQDWNWQPHYDLETMTKDMLEKLAANYNSYVVS